MLASVTDAAKAQAWADEIVTSGDTHATTTTETYNGTTITIVTPAASGDAKPMVPKQAAYAVVGPVLAVGDVASVKAAIDTGGTKGLNTVKQFQEAETTVSGDRLALSYVDAEGLVDGVEALAGAGRIAHAQPARRGRTSSPGPSAPSASRTARSSSRPATRTSRRSAGPIPPTRRSRPCSRRRPCSSPRATTWARR